MQIVWFGTICRVAWRVVRGENAADERSDEGRSVSFLINFVFVD